MVALNWLWSQNKKILLKSYVCNLTFHALWQTLSIIKLASLAYSTDGPAF